MVDTSQYLPWALSILPIFNNFGKRDRVQHKWMDTSIFKKQKIEMEMKDASNMRKEIYKVHQWGEESRKMLVENNGREAAAAFGKDLLERQAKKAKKSTNKKTKKKGRTFESSR